MIIHLGNLEDLEYLRLINKKEDKILLLYISSADMDLVQEASKE